MWMRHLLSFNKLTTPGTSRNGVKRRNSATNVISALNKLIQVVLPCSESFVNVYGYTRRSSRSQWLSLSKSVMAAPIKDWLSSMIFMSKAKPDKLAVWPFSRDNESGHSSFLYEYEHTITDSTDRRWTAYATNKSVLSWDPSTFDAFLKSMDVLELGLVVVYITR